MNSKHIFSKKKNCIQSVAKAITIIDLLAKRGRELSLGEIAKELNLAKSTVHGFLSTLRQFGYIKQSPLNGKYFLGIRLFEVGNIIAQTWDFRSVAMPYIMEMSSEAEETVHLAILDKEEVLYIDKRETQESIKITTAIGSRAPVHCSALGKVFLADFPSSEVRRIISQTELTRFTKNTITDIEKLEQELVEVRQYGYAVDYEEFMPNLRCVAAPIKDYKGKACAAVSISGPLNRFSEHRINEIAKIVTTGALHISQALGYKIAGK